MMYVELRQHLDGDPRLPACAQQQAVRRQTVVEPHVNHSTHRREDAIEPIRKPPGTVPILRRPQSKMGTAPLSLASVASLDPGQDECSSCDSESPEHRPLGRIQDECEDDRRGERAGYYENRQRRHEDSPDGQCRRD